jgi:Chaperone of endosialidase
MKKYILTGLIVLGFSIAYFANAASWFLPPNIQRGDLIVATSTTQAVRLATGTIGSVLFIDPITKVPKYTATSTLGISGGSGTPVGANTTLQWNNSGSFAGANLFYTTNSRLGINSTTPTANLVVQGTTTSPTIPVFVVSTDTGVFLFNVQANGNVGIGTVGPAAGLHVAQNESASLTGILESDGSSANGAGLRLRHARGTVANPAEVTAGDTAGVIVGQVYTGTNFLSLGEIDFGTESTAFTSGLRPASFINFYTNSVNGSQTERMRITSGGNVGIGSTTPNDFLSVAGNIRATGNTYLFGPNEITNFFCLRGSQCLSMTGNDNSSLGVSIETLNTNSGGSAYSFLGLGNNLFESTGLYYAGLGLNSSGYNSSAFGTLFTSPNQMALQTNLGPISIISATGTNSYINFGVGGGNIANEIARLTTSGLLIGTTTPTTGTLFIQGSGAKNPLEVTSSTGTSLLEVLANGNVGIGTNAPTAKLDIAGSGVLLNIGLTSASASLNVSGDRAEFGYDGTWAYMAGNGKPLGFAPTESSSNKNMQIISNNLICLGGTETSGTDCTGAQATINTSSMGINTTTLPTATLTIKGVASKPSLLIASSSGATLIMIPNNGFLGVGTQTPVQALDVVGSIQQSAVLNCDDATHQLGTDVNGKIVCDTALSDRRLKKNINQINGTYASQLIQSIPADSFFWKDKTKSRLEQLGFMAQDVQKSLPNLVKLEPNGYYSLDKIQLIPILWAALNEQIGRLNAVILRLETQDKQIKDMQTQIDAQKNEINQLIKNNDLR